MPQIKARTKTKLGGRTRGNAPISGVTKLKRLPDTKVDKPAEKCSACGRIVLANSDGGLRRHKKRPKSLYYCPGFLWKD